MEAQSGAEEPSSPAVNVSAGGVGSATKEMDKKRLNSQDTARHLEILKGKHLRQLQELGETIPSLRVWRKRCWSGMASSSTANGSGNRNSSSTPPSLDEAINLIGLAPKGSNGILASELGLLIYNQQADDTKKMMQKIATAAKDQAKEIKEGRERALEAANTSKAAAAAAAAEAKSATAIKSTEQQPSDEADSRRRTRRREAQAQQAAVDAENAAAAEAAAKDDEEEEDDEDGDEEADDADDWVQCEQCDKWRRLPPKYHPLYPKILAEKWSCSMNNWDENSKSCSAPEESVNKKELTQVAKKIRIWLRRIKSGDKYAKMYASNHGDGTRDTSVSTRGVTDWIRCTNPQCGKWRACLRNMSSKVVKDRYPDWTCWMNSWDETRASCTAPQEGTCVRSLAQVEMEEHMAAEEEKKALEREMKGVSNGMGRMGGIPGGSLSGSSKPSDVDDEIEYTRGVSQRGRIVRSRWTAQARRRFLGK